MTMSTSLPGEQKLGLLGALGAAEVVVGGQQPARELGQGRLVVDEQHRALESTHDEVPCLASESDESNRPPPINPLRTA